MHKIEKFCVVECREIHRFKKKKRRGTTTTRGFKIQNHLKYLICISCWICMWPWPMATTIVKMFLIQVSMILWIQTVFWSLLSTHWFFVFNAWFYHTLSCNHNIECFTICYLLCLSNVFIVQCSAMKYANFVLFNWIEWHWIPYILVL